MKYINRKQKKILIIVITIITIGVTYYAYTSFGRNDFTIESSELEINGVNEEDGSKVENGVGSEEKEDENNKERMHYVQARNLLYVACSRARKNLYVVYKTNNISEIKENIENIFGDVHYLDIKKV